MRIALAQVDSQLGDVDANVVRAAQVIAEATAMGSDLIVFPELFLSGYSVGMVDRDLAIRADDPRLLGLAEEAGAAGLVIGFVEAGPVGLHRFNAAAYYEAGERVHVHRKLYLPTYGDFEERKHFSPGRSMRAFPPGGNTRMALLICNDAWQPQIPFIATHDGALVLIVPAASAQSRFPDRYDSRGYWRGMTRFYGRMLQLFVVFVNRVGAEGDLRFWGGSHVVDPWGEVMSEASDQEQLLTVDIDLEAVRQRRYEVPLVREARLGLLRREIDRLLLDGDDDD